MAAMGTHAALIVDQAGGNVVVVDKTRTHFDVWVRVTLIDRRIEKRTWEALVRYRGSVDETTIEDGGKFAATVVARLHSDGMISCESTR